MAITDNLVSGYKFEGNSNDVLTTNNGTDTSIVYSTGNGKVNQGAGFGGSSKIVLTTTGFPSGASNRTFSCWFKPAAQPSLNTDNTIFCYGAETANLGFIVSYSDVSGVKKITFDNYGTPLQITQTLNNGTYYHIVVTYDGTTIVIYINGASVGSAARTLNTTALNGRIGCFYDAGASNKINGAVDELYLWSRVLTTTEINDPTSATANLYNEGNGSSYKFLLNSVSDTIRETDSIQQTYNITYMDTVRSTDSYTEPDWSNKQKSTEGTTTNVQKS